MMNDAVSAGTCFFGRDAAREALWKFVGPDTVLITHAGENDMNVFRMIHHKVVDTQALRGGRVGLARLCSSMFGISIQDGAGHDSLEDTLATPGLALRYVQREIEAKQLNRIARSVKTTLTEDEERTQAKPITHLFKGVSWAQIAGSIPSTKSAGTASRSDNNSKSSFEQSTSTTQDSTEQVVDDDEDELRADLVDAEFDGQKINFR
jgi:DNA polymerase III epsilon subunit-like protein